MTDRVVAAAHVVVECFQRGGKLLLFGNGGSASDAQHVAAEFVNRFVAERRALPALALTTDTSALTSIANDRSYEEVFSRQVEAWGRAGDVAIAISTSGNSPSVLRAVETCKARGLTTIGLTGGGGGALAPRVDLLIDVGQTRNTARIQEIHITVGHVLCDLVDAALMGAG
ncbi:MAG: SIS domain-containing protein [Deltaproteobacteria bacterium]|nr:SIS domain-containing protein [Deltaproteobacteria bacterium]